jgi:manganese oxidase
MPTEPIPTPQPAESPAEPELDGGASALSRRGFLRAAGVVGLTGIAASVAACQAAATPQWSFGAPATPAAATAVPSVAPSVAPSAAATAAASSAPSVAPSPSPDANLPAGWTEHDAAARNKVRRYVGNLALPLQNIYPAPVYLKLAELLGVQDDYPELKMKPAFVQVPQLVLNDAVNPLTPTLEGDTKVFHLTIDEMEWKIDELMPSVKALGYNAQWPGPTIRVNEGDKLRVVFKNNLPETTTVHFHGEEFEDFFQDGVPFVNQLPIPPGQEFTYDFVASRQGSLMYHSHHNATDQVGRGLLGGYVVDPQKPSADDKFDREYIWISNDSLGGFTINGHGFPAVVPVLAAQGETVRVRFMNEGSMMHPWHLHGNTMKVVARDGYPLGSASFECDTLGVNPGERYDVNIKANTLGIWAFHCHILPHVEGLDGMFGMVSTLMVVPKSTDVDAIVQALLA